MWDTIKRDNICIMGVPEEEREKRPGKDMQGNDCKLHKFIGKQ